MATIVTASNLLINIFRFSDKKIISISELKDIRATIEFELSDLYIDITKDSLMEAVQSYPESFLWEDDGIHYICAIDGNIDINYMIPDKYRARYLHILKETLK